MHKVEYDKSGGIPTFLIDDMQLEHCDLIFLDVEGFELEALKGATETIKKFGPLVMAERYENKEEIVDFLVPLGYEEIGFSAHDLVMKCK